jgi:hypothetical protein
MSHYSNNAASVRVDFFRPSGKWYTTEAVLWTGEYADCLIHEAFAKSLRDHFAKHSPPERLSGMDAICLEPYHEHSHPIQIKCGRWLVDCDAKATGGSNV